MDEIICELSLDERFIDLSYEDKVALAELIVSKAHDELKGEKGDKGDAGNSGVYIGDSEPTDPDISIWFSEDPSDQAYFDQKIAEIKEDLVNTTNGLKDQIQQKGQESLNLLPGDVAAVGASISQLSESITEISNEVNDLFNPSKNLYDFSKRVEHAGLSSTGAVAETSGFVNYAVSAPIKVEQGKTLYFSYNGVSYGAHRVASYREDGTAFNVVSNPFTYEIPEGAVTIRFSGALNRMVDFMQCQYDEITPFEDFGLYFKNERLDHKNVVFNKVRYVAFDGNDSNDGLSETTPFLTFGKAVGDGAEVIYVKAGNYTGSIVSNNKKLKIRVYGGQKAIVDNGKTTNYVVRCDDGEIDIRGIEVKNSNRYGFYLLRCNGVLDNCSAIGCSTMGIALDGSQITLNECKALSNGTDGFNAHDSGDYVSDCTFVNCLSDGNGDDGLSFHEHGIIHVIGGEYANNTSGGITPYGQCVADIQNAYVHHNQRGIYGFQSESGGIGDKPTVRTHGNLVTNNSFGLSVSHYNIVSIGDKLADNTTDVSETDGVITRY